ncbi:hypothetical protein F4604DRAFT_1584981 [Suillus subluteus]|nr:hypothetical protein F4604DRAFT_1584981 [Suillus subluteus]
MTTYFKTDEVKSFTDGDTWGFCMTESFGMRFGRATRNMSLEGTAILFAEKEYFDQYKMEKEKRKRQAMPSNPNKQQAVAVTDNVPPPHHKISQPTALEPGMDHLINADVRPGIGCRHKVLDAFFKNETAEHFAGFISVIPKRTKQPSHSHIAKFSMASTDFKLVDDWQEDTTQKLYGQAHLHDLGPGLVMPNNILNRIVECAHFHKIKSPADLLRETRWSGVNKPGDDIVTLIL